MADLRWPAAAEAALKAAQEAGLPGVLDADTVPTPVPEGPFAAASHILFSSDGLSLYDGERSRRESALVRAGQETGAWVGVSAGGEGAYWVDNDGLHHRPAFRVQAVNTLGAGDVMHGAFTLALAEGQDAAEALTFASAAAGAKIARADGGLPTREDVRGLIQAR
jgi:sulfofructose kinase